METKTSFNQYIPTNIVFGCGELNNLHKHQLPGKKALLVISNGTSTKVNGYLARTVELSNEDCIKIYQQAYK